MAIERPFGFINKETGLDDLNDYLRKCEVALEQKKYPDHSLLVKTLMRYKTTEELYESPEYKFCEPYLKKLFTNPISIDPGNVESREAKENLNVITWNMEKGKGNILEFLRENEEVKNADVIVMQEVTIGMAYANNTDWQRVLAQELGMYAVFIPCYLEFTKGIGKEADAPGNNIQALNGMLILSQYPIKMPDAIQVGEKDDYFEHKEKRLGQLNALAVDITVSPRQTVQIVDTHMEILSDPQGRARKMTQLYNDLTGATNRKRIVAGDFNTTGFSAKDLDAFKNLMGLWLHPKTVNLTNRLEPDEPLLKIMENLGFSITNFGIGTGTCHVNLDGLEYHITNPILKKHTPAIKRLIEVTARHNLPHEKLTTQLDFILSFGLERANTPEATKNIIAVHDGKRVADHDMVQTSFALTK